MREGLNAARRRATTRFVGRDTELRDLREALQPARDADPAVVLVEGEAGIGKTALVRRFLQDAGDAVVLWASGDEDETDLEFGIVEQLRSDAGSDRLPAASPGMSSMTVGAGLLAGLAALESGRPVVVVIDDLHLADSASARALLFVLRRLRRDPVLLVATARTRRLDRLGAGWARVFANNELTTTLRLEGLGAGEVRELAAARGRPIPAHGGERLRAHTGGNPLYVGALLEELSDGALRAHHEDLPAPHSYTTTILVKFARLPRPAQAFVAAAAVLGSVRAPLREVTRVCRAVDSSAAADRAEAAGFVRVVVGPAGHDVEFTHPLVRAAVYESISAARRRELHRLAADGAGLDPAIVLRHLVRAAGGPDPELAARLCALADEDIARGALPTAATSLELASQVEPDEDAADSHLYRAVQLWSGCADVEALRGCTEQVRGRRPSDYQRLILAVLDAAEGRMVQAVADLRELAESLSVAAQPDLFSRVATALGFFSALMDDHEEAIRWTTRARESAVIHPFIDSTARQGLVSSYAMTGRIGEALSLLGDCSPGHGRPAPFEADLLALRGLVHTWAGEHAAAVADLEAVDRWVRLGYPCVSTTRVHAALAEAELRLGDWHQAAAHAELAVTLAEALDHAWYMPYAQQVATHVFALLGDDDASAAHAAAARQWVGAGAMGEGFGYAALADAHRAWAVGDWPAVEVALRPLAEAAATVRDHPNLAMWHHRMAEAWIHEGRAEEALALLEQAPSPPWGGVEPADRCRLRALALWRCGDTVAAGTAYVEGMTRLHGPPESFADALLALDYGRFLLDTGQPASATAVLRASREVLRRLGAVRFREACEAALVRAEPVALHDLPKAPRLEVLTPRERVVAGLVADGATNREVAAQLYLSVKGVEYHLRNIFTKLGITSRRQLRSLRFVEPDVPTGGAR